MDEGEGRLRVRLFTIKGNKTGPRGKSSLRFPGAKAGMDDTIVSCCLLYALCLLVHLASRQAWNPFRADARADTRADRWTGSEDKEHLHGASVPSSRPHRSPAGGYALLMVTSVVGCLHLRDFRADCSWCVHGETRCAEVAASSLEFAARLQVTF